MRGTESSALHVLRAIEEEAGKRKAAEILVYAASSVALYVLNNKRSWLQEIESHHNLTVQLAADDSLIPPTLRIERIRPYVAPAEPVAPPAAVTHIPIDTKAPIEADPAGESWSDEQPEIVAAPPSPVAAVPALGESEGDEASRRRKRRRRRRGGRREDGTPVPDSAEAQAGSDEDDGESDLGPVFESEPGEPDVAVVAAAAEPLPQDDGTAAAVSDATPETVPDDVPADAAPRGRRRRGGGRNRVRPDIDDTAVLDTAPVDDTDQPRRAPRAYVGPTPADPFAGSFDIFEMIEREAEENLALAPDPSASAASLASGPTVVPAPAAPPAAAEAETLPLPEPASQPVVPSLAEPLAASAAEPAGEPKAKLPTTSLSQTPPDSVPDPVPDAEPAADADTVPVAEAETAPPAKAARVAKPRKPRASRAKKPVLAEPVAEPAAGDAVSDTAPQTPEAVPDAPDAPQPVPVTVHPEPDNAAPEPQGASEPEAEPDAAAPAASDRSIVQPIVIGSDSPAPARRTGWWKR
jgi:ribonuclease E